MMEIKVRGWHATQKKMYSAEELAADQLTLLTTGQFINVSGDSTRLSVIYPRDKFIPLLYTGLKDKNGVEVYEGDIYQKVDSITGKHLGYCTVEYLADNNYAGWSFSYDLDEFGEFPDKEWEVIGNIYENPELLEVNHA